MDYYTLSVISICLAAVALLAVGGLARAVVSLKRSAGARGEKEGHYRPDEEPLDPELMAAIVAAIAAARGGGTEGFRVVGISQSLDQGGWNTPIWGHAGRIASRSRVR
jgi:hypothetical protein